MKVIMEDLLTDLKSGDIAIDCGANIGDITDLMAKNGATVYAFEPNPYAYQILKKRFAVKTNVICINKGVWDKDCRVRLYFHQNSDKDEVKWSTGSSIMPTKKNVNPNKFVEIEVIDLIEFINMLNSKVKLLKIDIEGAECEVLEKIIKQHLHLKINTILAETHESKIVEIKEKINWIRERIRNENIHHIYLCWK